MKPTLFIGQDGTLFDTPNQDSPTSPLQPNVMPALLALTPFYRLVLIRQQDDDKPSHQATLDLLSSQGIDFDDVLCYPNDLDNQPATDRNFDPEHSFVIGDKAADVALAQTLGIGALVYHRKDLDWTLIAEKLSPKPYPSSTPRHAKITRTTKETNIVAEVWLDEAGVNDIKTGIGFFNHMLDQIATHAGFKMRVHCDGDLWIDEHHSVEDTALALGAALKEALGNKRGIARFGFVLPMDECQAQCVLDLSGRPFFKFKGKFKREKVGDFSCEMTEHFFQSLAFAMMATLHLKVKGDNDHHKIESLFKVFGRTLRQAIKVESQELPSSKGVL